MRTWLCPLLIVGCFFAASELQGSEAPRYPSKPIRIIVAAGPGGPNEIVARVAADALSKLGQPAVVEHRPGAGGAIGAKAVAAAPADGHTLLVGNTATLAVVPAVSSRAGYDPAKDFTAIAKFWESYQVIVVPPSGAAKSLREFVEAARAQPGKFSYAHGTTGGLPHLAGELFRLRANIEMVGVPYRSEPEFMMAVMSGEVQMAFPSLEAALPLIRDGKLRALAVTSASRTHIAPDLATVAEEGIADYAVTTFFGIVAPAGTPSEIIQTLNATLNQTLRSEETRATVAKIGVVSNPGSPEYFAAFIADQRNKWDATAKQAGVRIE